jgi:hypothetical protein
MIKYRFRVTSAAVFTLYSYSKALEYRFRVPTADSLMSADSLSGHVWLAHLTQVSFQLMHAISNELKKS